MTEVHQIVAESLVKLLSSPAKVTKLSVGDVVQDLAESLGLHAVVAILSELDDKRIISLSGIAGGEIANQHRNYFITIKPGGMSKLINMANRHSEQ